MVDYAQQPNKFYFFAFSNLLDNMNTQKFQEVCAYIFGNNYMELNSNFINLPMTQLVMKHSIVFYGTHSIPYNDMFVELLFSCSDSILEESEFKLLYGPRPYSIMVLRNENIDAPLQNDNSPDHILYRRFSIVKFYENLDQFF